MTARDRLMIVIVAVIAAVACSWLFVIQPKRDQAAKLDAKLSSVQSQLQTARQQAALSVAARSQFASSYTVLAKLGEAVPADDNVPSLVVQVQSAANAAHVDFRGLTLVNGSSSASSTTSTSATQSAVAALPPGATVGPAGFPIEPFTFSFQGNFFHLADFLGRLQRFVVATNTRMLVSGRLMTLNAISLGAAPQGFPQITASISATTYLVPATQGVMNGATPSGPAAGSSTQGVSTPSTTSPAPAAVITQGIR
jgi:hypothetical protein